MLLLFSVPLNFSIDTVAEFCQMKNQSTPWVLVVKLSIMVHAMCYQSLYAQVLGLDFPGSKSVDSTMRFKFEKPHEKGLPIYGPDGRGVTYIWRAYPRQQSGYYTAFFWGNDDGKDSLDTFLWTDEGDADSYYGAHPYPQPPPDGADHSWEVSVERQDFVNGEVVYDRWYVQALRVWSDWMGKHHEFYWDLPKTDRSHSVIRISSPEWGNTLPPAPALTWGDAPWAPGNEVWNGILTGIQIYSAKLPIEAIKREVQLPFSTSIGRESMWYLNLNPTPTDISDKSGRGNDPVWVGEARPKLFIAEHEGTSPASTRSAN